MAKSNNDKTLKKLIRDFFSADFSQIPLMELLKTYEAGEISGSIMWQSGWVYPLQSEHFISRNFESHKILLFPVSNVDCDLFNGIV